MLDQITAIFEKAHQRYWFSDEKEILSCQTTELVPFKGVQVTRITNNDFLMAGDGTLEWICEIVVYIPRGDVVEIRGKRWTKFKGEVTFTPPQLKAILKIAS